MPTALAPRFVAKIRFGECWEWLGAQNGEGYGSVRIGGRRGRAQGVHRVIYEALVGPIPDGLELDHLCRNRVCCNPAHLEPVTRHLNIVRGMGPSATRARAVAMTHCRRGHPLFGNNLYRTPNGRRNCRACRAAATRRYQRKDN